jgi:HK97 family phage portal protein
MSALVRVRDRIARGVGAKGFQFPSAGALTAGVSGADGYGGLGPLMALLPGTDFDYRKEAGLLWLNTVVLAGINWIADAWLEAPPCLYERQADAEEKPIGTDPLLDLLENPNPDYDATVLLWATILSLWVDGNAYWFKRRNAAGQVVQLYYLPHYLCAPWWLANGEEFIAGYVYRPNGIDLPIPKTEIVHLRIGMDMSNVRKGMTRLGAVLREICSDNEAASYTAALLRNFGVPGVLLSPKNDQVSITAEQQDRLKILWRERTTGERRGEPITAPKPISVDKITLTPEEMALDKLSAMSPPRICSSMGLDPMVLGLPSPQKTYSNYAEAREAAWENTLIPSQTRMDRQLTHQLLHPDFGPAPNRRVGHNYAKVRALQPDLDKQYARQTRAVGGPWMLPNEARSLTNLPPWADGDTMYPAPGQGAPGESDLAAEETNGPAKRLKARLAELWRQRRDGQ